MLLDHWRERILQGRFLSRQVVERRIEAPIRSKAFELLFDFWPHFCAELVQLLLKVRGLTLKALDAWIVCWVLGSGIRPGKRRLILQEGLFPILNLRILIHDPFKNGVRRQ